MLFSRQQRFRLQPIKLGVCRLWCPDCLRITIHITFPQRAPSLVRMPRQSEMKVGAPSVVGRGPQMATMRLDDGTANLRVRSKGNRHLHCGPAPGLAIERKCPVQLEHPLSHIDQPQAARFSDLVGGAADAIIGHREPDATVGPRKPNLNLGCFGIFGGITECFLSNAVETQCCSQQTTRLHSHPFHTRWGGPAPG